MIQWNRIHSNVLFVSFLIADKAKLSPITFIPKQMKSAPYWLTPFIKNKGKCHNHQTIDTRIVAMV